MKNVNELIAEMAEVFELARKDRLPSEHIKNVVSSANTILKGCAVALKKAELSGEIPDIPFLNGNKMINVKIKKLTTGKKEIDYLNDQCL